MIVLADLYLGPELLLKRTALFPCGSADRTDNGLALLLDLDHLELDGLADKLREICVLGERGLGRGDEHTGAHNGSHNAALHRFGDSGFKGLVVLLGFGDLVPVLVKVSTLLGKHSAAVHVADADNECIYCVADLVQLAQLYRSIVCSLIGGQYTGDFSAEIKLHFLIADGDNCTGNGVSCI